MKTSINLLMRGIAVVLSVTALTACEKREAAENGAGPAERAGQQLDQATARAGEELNKAAEKAGQGLQQLGKKLQNEAKEAQDEQKKE
jgi:16S rRNA G527 N7-methylase RsmG